MSIDFYMHAIIMHEEQIQLIEITSGMVVLENVRGFS